MLVAMNKRDVSEERQVGLPPGELEVDHERQADLATAVAANFFGPPAIQVSFSLAARAEAEAEALRRLDGAENFVRVAPSDRPSYLRNRKEEEDDGPSDGTAAAFSSLQARRQREEWAQTEHSFGSTTLTGAQWQELGQDLRGDTEMRRWLLEKIQRDGKSRAEAERIAKDVADIADIMAKPPSQRTAEEKRRLEDAQKNPELQGYAKEAAEHQKRLRGQRSERDRAVESGSTDKSTAARADELSSFKSAPDMRSHYTRVGSGDSMPPESAPASGATQPPPAPAASGFNI